MIEKQKINVVCPDCLDEFTLDTVPQKDEIITCPNCWAGLIVSRWDPLELSWDIAADEDDLDNE
jgi:hypothetical protein